MTITLRTAVSAEDVGAAIAPIFHYFGVTPPEQAVTNFTTLMTPSRVLLAQDGPDTIGGCGSFPLQLTTRGGHVAACGLSMVGVMPTHRRRGVLRAMMRQIFADCRARDEAVAYLWASDERIYGRYGFGLTGFSGDVAISRDHTAFVLPHTQGARIRRVSPAEALETASRIYAAVTSRTPGAFARSADWWRLKSLTDPAWRRHGGGELQCALLDFDGEPAAYALYRMNFDTERGVPTGTVQVIEAVGDTPRADAAIWRYLLDMDWTATIKADYLPLDHFLLLAAQQPRRLNLRLRDGAWLRVVDLPKALAARSYGPGEPVVIEIDDADCPWNTGRWLIGCDGVQRTDRNADIRCAIDALACIYLGGFTWRQLVASGRAQSNSEDATVRADRIFETGAAPWCPEIF